MNFVCIKWGTKYEPHYVNNLYRMVQKNYTKDFTFTCYTDDPEGLECDTKPIPDIELLHPKHWFDIENMSLNKKKMDWYQDWLEKSRKDIFIEIKS